MKKLKNILALIGVGAFLLSSCSDEWDKHYSQKDQEIDLEGLTVIDDQLLDYLGSAPEYSSMYNLLERTKILDSMKTRDQVFTILTVNNSLLDTELDDEKYTAMSFISDLAFSPANMSNGQRILMWNGKYLNITIDENGTIAFNGSETVKIMKLNDGYIYELNSLLSSPKSLIEFIEGLSDDYSMFRDSVLKYNAREFDRENSIPVGIDATGSTIYDTVWITTNKFFEIGTGSEQDPKGMNIFSEGINGTVLVPSNEVVLASWAHAEARMKKWNLTDIPESLPDSIAHQWFYKVAFINSPLTAEELNNGDEDLNSIFHVHPEKDNAARKNGIRYSWRPGIQRVNPDPVILSNSTVYYVDYLQTPINVMIWRIKDYFWNFDKLEEHQKAEHYYFDNLEEEPTWDTGVTHTVPYMKFMEYGVYQDGKFVCRTAQHAIIQKTIEDEEGNSVEYKNENGYLYEFEFKPYHFHWENNNPVTYHYLIPPGTYKFAMGLEQNAKHLIDIEINGKLQASLSSSDWSRYHYDRNGNGRWPYGYTGSTSTFCRDGGATGEFIFTEESGTPVTIRIKCSSLNGSGRGLPLYTWCFTPTDDCY